MRYLLTLFIALNLTCNTHNEATAQLTAQSVLFVMSGESNAGGYAKNEEASILEMRSRPSVKILNNATLSSFDNLYISSIGDGLDNTHVGHRGTESWGARHGWEIEIANLAAKGVLTNPAYIVKTAQGASKIVDWKVGVTVSGYNGINTTIQPWQAFQDRVDAALSLRPSSSIVILYSQGINDKIAGTDTATWKTETIAHFAKIRAKYGQNIPILITDFTSITGTDMSTYNTALRQIVASNLNNYLISSAGAGLDTDTNHWNDAGIKLIADRMVSQTIKLFSRAVLQKTGRPVKLR